MSLFRDFRVTVNLSNFFHDHRNRARIFINDDIRTINDLKKRIEKIFNIKNFHLFSQNDFLPPSEDTRILQKDDIIWVIQNGDNYEETFTPKVPTKNDSNKSDSIGKKRSISLTDLHIEEELRSPKKKKKKKHELEIHQERLLGNNKLKKKKKKEKRTDTVSCEEKCSSTEAKYNSPKQEKNKKKIHDRSSENKVSATPEQGLDSLKNNVMKINTLLPVLHSHINTYNKKLSSNHLNKSAKPAASETSSPSVIKGSESENEKKKRHTYKGNLSQYKRNIPLPTITDKYLEQKKINIVKIEYLNIRPAAASTCDSEAETCNQSSEKKSTTVTEDQNTSDAKDIIKQNATSDDINLSTKVVSTPRTNSMVKGMSNSDGSNDISMEKTNETETKNTNLKPYVSPNQDLTNNNLNQDLRDTSTGDIRKTISEHDTKTDIDLINVGGTSPSLSPCKEGTFKNSDSKSSTESTQMDLRILSDRYRKSTSPEVKKSNETFSSIAINTTRLVLKNPNVPYHQKYFTFKALAAKECDSTNTSDSSKASFNINKENSTSNISTKDSLIDLQNVPNSNESIQKMDAIDNKTNKSSEDLTSHSGEPSKKTCDEAVPNIPNDANMSVETDDKPSKTTTELLDDAANKSLISITASDTNDPGNFVEDPNTSLRDGHRNSVTSEMDLAKDITNLDESEVSKISTGGTSRFFKLKQQSGIGQLVQDLRGNDSVVSVESLDSDSSQFVTKRKRKRVRKRKKKDTNINSDSSLNDSSLMITEAYVQKPLNVKACPLMHIRFDDNEEGKKVTNVLTEQNTRSEKESYVENITIKSDLEESKLEVSIKEDDIFKSPSMKLILPKIGDFIAFKILRITENYSPEVSSYITGKVIEFNTETKQVTFEILSGLEQCESPKGKLSMEVDAEISETTGNRREFAWVELIDPRLLYP